jgi:hypothetical protein
MPGLDGEDATGKAKGPGGYWEALGAMGGGKSHCSRELLEGVREAIGEVGGFGRLADASFRY